MPEPLGHVSHPDQLLREELARFTAAGGEQRGFSFTFTLSRDWLDGSAITLGAVCEFRRAPHPVSRIALTDQPQALAALAEPELTLADFCATHAVAQADLAAPLALSTHHEPKPWGEEIWYTGIEQRGVCSAEGIPLPWLLALDHPQLAVPGLRAPILLKILAPHPGEVEGDLYFEVHREKVEVYVITGIDPAAWPDGRGRIRIGFEADRIAGYPDRAAFEAAYLASVRRYREVRDVIDRELDQFRDNAGYPPAAVVPAEVIRQWQEELPVELRLDEQARRSEMDAFYAVRELQVGDVVQILPGIPHSLQHGVRAVEFQTPHYERLILSFGQKVLTQSHWDTEEAVAEMALEQPVPPALPRIADDAGARVELAARFDRFEVHRVALAPGASYRPRLSDYALAIGVTGTTRVAGREMAPEQAFLLPLALAAPEFCNATAAPAICLIARPR